MGKRRYKKKPNGKNAVGRPEQYTDPNEVITIAKNYFKKCADEKTDITITGLCIALDLTRQGLQEYEDKPLFSDAIKKIRMYVVEDCEKKIGRYPAGMIFKLKNIDKENWVDKVETDLTLHTFEHYKNAKGKYGFK
jgi:hypothetical protein